MKQTKTIGIKVKAPTKECADKKCPFHGNIKVRGRSFTGIIIKKDVHRSATVEWTRKIKIPKYERFEKKRTKIHVHNPPCMNAKEGDIVNVMECRPLSKTKNFVIIENLGKQFGFEQMEEAREESKKVTKKKEKPEVSEENQEDTKTEEIKEENTDESN
jgi:small subunit ribosomal protein S17|tara:strand:- start:1301 stop:1777 length:477 start_codon:yes stop_codon:yes gene_type:complete